MTWAWRLDNEVGAIVVEVSTAAKSLVFASREVSMKACCAQREIPEANNMLASCKHG